MNPARLKLELFCRGATIAPGCPLEQDTRPVKRTRGGLGSGVDAILPGGVWVNIPVEEAFAQHSPYLIDYVGGKYCLRRGVEEICRLRLPPRPAWYDEATRGGKRVGDIGVMQGTYFAVYPSALCGFWKTEPQTNCRFCSVGLCHGQTESAEKTVDDVVDAVRLARKHERITFVHFNTGYAENDGGLEAVFPYVTAVKRATGLLVGVQCPPAADLTKYDRLKKMGADHVSFCFEIFDPMRFAEVCPGKAETFGEVAGSLRNDFDLEAVRTLAEKHLGDTRPHPGQLIFYRALRHCVKLWGKGPVAGEIVAGLESPARSVQAVEFLADLGAVATVCVFRPCVGTDYEHLPPPDPDELAPVFARQYEVTIERGIPHGVAPNIQTAMVHTQQESRAFARKGLGQWGQSGRYPHLKEAAFHAKTTAMKSVYRTLCAIRRKRIHSPGSAGAK